MNILFYDTETTGLPVWGSPSGGDEMRYNAALTGAEGVRVEGTVMQHNDERSCDV